jgi:quinol monooxygenase YgiN
MIIVLGSIRAEAAEIERLQDVLVEQMKATHAEDGCELYAFSRDVSDPDLLLISERWRDADALAAHGKSAHMAVFNRQMASAKVESISVSAYDVTGARVLIGK